jgi:hypothetical protein
MSRIIAFFRALGIWLGVDSSMTRETLVDEANWLLNQIKPGHMITSEYSRRYMLFHVHLLMYLKEVLDK